MIHVVSGLVLQADEMLMGLRKPGKKRPNLWELPGGKVEAQENPQRALEREWREEMNVDIIAQERIATAVFEWDDYVVVDLHVVKFTSFAHGPKAIDHAELRWVRLDQALNDLPCSPAFYVHYPFIKRWWSAL